MQSLQYLNLFCCGLRAVPAFVGELKSLESLLLSRNDEQIFATLDFLVKASPRLRKVFLTKRSNMAPWTPETLAHIEAFKAKLLAKNPKDKVFYD